MSKPLNEMTLEELWELFPIFLVEHNEKWKLNFHEMEMRLRSVLSDFEIARLSHIGSTAVSGIMAKDIVDILLEAENDEDIEKIAKAAESIGFIIMSSEPKRISLNYGYTPDGFTEKVYHLHIRSRGDNDELYFRDYLNEHPETAREYEKLKLSLWQEFPHNRDAYTSAKTDFVKKYTSIAKELYGKKYI